MAKLINEIEAFKKRVGRVPKDPLFVREPHHEKDDDDLGLPESPIDSNYSKYLWTSHKRRSGTKRRNINAEKVNREERKDLV
jgi:hypothetical protein